jgi:hypothetical protein
MVANGVKLVSGLYQALRRTRQTTSGEDLSRSPAPVWIFDGVLARWRRSIGIHTITRENRINSNDDLWTGRRHRRIN